MTQLYLRRLVAALLFALSTTGGSLWAQGALDRTVSGEFKDLTLIEMLLDLEKRYPPLRFYYEPEVLPYYKLNYTVQSEPLFSVLQRVLSKNGLVCVASGNDGVVILRKSDVNREYIVNLVKKWDNKQVEMPEFLLPYTLERSSGAPPANGSQPVAVTLRLFDEESREGVAAAVIRLSAADSLHYEGPKGAVSGNTGLANLNLPPGRYTLRIEFLGYRETIVQLDVWQGSTVEIPLRQRLQNLQEVVIQGNKAADKVNTTTAGIEALPTQMVRELPALLGQADLIKSLSVLPGVSTVGEGAAGFNVRGGSVDQNLVQQDGLTLYNTSHVLGFFSVFDPDLVGTTTLYKGHIPAQYGGRIASVLDVQLRTPNYQQWHGNAGVGLTSAKFNVEGPIVPGKVSVMAGVRSSYSDWLLKTARLPNVRSSSAWFRDGTAKIAARIGDNGSLELSGHRSRDYFRFAQEFGYEWSTTGGSATFRTPVATDVLLIVNASAGRLTNAYFAPSGTEAFDLKTTLNYQRARAQLQYLRWTGHEIRGGLEWSRAGTAPQQLTPRGDESSVAARTVQQDRGEERSLFLEDDWKLSPRLSVYAGLRYTSFRQVGAGQQFEYEAGAPLSEGTLTDTVFFGKGQTMQRYGGFEPRISVNFRLDEGQSIKLSYNRLRQYIHLITNTTAATPADLWQVSTTYIPPQTGDSYSLGYYRNFLQRSWETSVEGFFRNVDDVPAYRDFADLLLNDHLETELIAGQMRSYGLEYSLRRKEGRLTGSLGYTWARAIQRAVSPYPGLSINRGEWFPANYDQPHQGNLQVKWARNPAHYWNFNFTYRTGRPVSAPQSGYQTGNSVVPFFPGRNNLRIPDYHRLDVGYTIDRSKAQLKGLSWTLNFSIYNLYARQNPFAVYFKRDKGGIPKAYQLSAIGSAIPAVNFNLVW